MALWAADKIMQRRYSRNCRNQRRRNLRITCVCPVLFAIDNVFVNGSVKCLTYLARGPGKLQYRSPFRSSHLKAVGLQPSGNCLHVRVRRAEFLPEFLRGEPLVIIRRMPVLLIVKQLAQRQLLFRTAFQHQQHSLHWQRCRRSPQIEFRPGQGMGISLQRRELPFVDSLGDERPRNWTLRAILSPPGPVKSQNANSNPHQRAETEASAGKRSPECVHTHLDWDHGASKRNGQGKGGTSARFAPPALKPADQKHYINISCFSTDFRLLNRYRFCPLLSVW